MRKNDFVDKIYDYYYQHPTPGIKITKVDLKKFPSKILARGYFAIVDHNTRPKVLSLLIRQKQEKTGKKSLINCLISYYHLHPTPNIEITKSDLIKKNDDDLRRAANLVLNDKFPWLLIEIINRKRTTKGQLSLF